MNTHRSPISRAKLEAIRAAKMPNTAEAAQAAAEFPNDPMAAAIRAHELAYERRCKVK